MSNEDYIPNLPFGHDYYEICPPQTITNKEEDNNENKNENSKSCLNMKCISANTSTRRTTDIKISKDDFNNTKTNNIKNIEESDFVQFNNNENGKQLEDNHSLKKTNNIGGGFNVDYEKDYNLKIQSIENDIKSIYDKANKVDSLSDAYLFLSKKSELILQKQNLLNSKKLMNIEYIEDFSRFVNIKNNKEEKELKDKSLLSKKHNLLNPSFNNYEKREEEVKEEKEEEKEKNVINNNDEKQLNNNIEEKKNIIKPKRGRISKDLKEKGKIGEHDKNKEDNGLNKIFHKSLKSFYDFSLKLMKEIDENIDILKPVININSIINNTEKEKYIFKTIKENLCNFKPRRLNSERLEENKKKIEIILNTDVIGKEKEKLILNTFLNMTFKEGLSLYIYDKPYILIKEKGKYNRVDFSGLRTFKDDFRDYDPSIQNNFIKKAKELINEKSKKRRSRNKTKK